MRPVLRSLGAVPFALLLAALALPPPTGAQPVPDHFKCYKVTDAQAKASYTAEIDGLPSGKCPFRLLLR
jgi:hypothetical protein